MVAHGLRHCFPGSHPDATLAAASADAASADAACAAQRLEHACARLGLTTFEVAPLAAAWSAGGAARANAQAPSAGAHDAKDDLSGARSDFSVAHRLAASALGGWAALEALLRAAAAHARDAELDAAGEV